ncbi:hypothetical protein Bca101_100791 [Brassica carinata]
MESNKAVVPVTLKGGTNYLVWSRMVRTTVGSKGLWKHITPGEAPKLITQGETEGEAASKAESVVEKWQQEDMMVMSVLHASLEPAILDAYSYCETAKELWDTLKKVYGNVSNLNRVFEVKKAINELTQDDMEFTKHLGRFRTLWSELEMLRPSTVDPELLNERREQDKVFGLLLTLNASYNGLIQHMLRSEKLPDLEEVCAQIQREQGSMGLFGGKGDLSLANAVQSDREEPPQANKAGYNKYEKFNGNCDHCKRYGHKKIQCWILHPHLKPAKFIKEKEARAHMTEGSSGAGPSNRGTEVENREGNGKALNDHDYIRRSEMDALIKMLKENGNTHGYSFGASMIATSAFVDDIARINRIKSNENFRNEYTFARNARMNHESNAFRSPLNLCNNASNITKPLIVDSGASHHMISDTNLIKDIEPANGHVMIANGDKIPIRGIGNLKLFNKHTRAFYMPEFTSNLLSVKKCTTDLHCNVIFSPNDVKFQDIESSQLIGKGVTKGDLYMLEELAPVSESSCLFTTTSNLNKNALWHARLGHPHSRALNLMLPGVNFENKDCEACILGKHCKTVFQRSSTVYEKCFDLIHSDVWTAPCLSRENHKYFVTFIDEKSKYTWLTLIPSKDRVLDAFKNFQAYVTNHYHAKIKIFRSDNGGEYTSHAFKSHLAKHGIVHQTSCPYTPQQNGVAERKNRHLMEVARSMMFHANVPKRFWSDAVQTACYLINRVPTKILKNLSPFEVLNKSKPVIDHLRVFGCVCYVMVPGEQRNKLEAKSTKAMFIGYSITQKGYKCYDPEARRVMVSREVKFVETKGYYEEKEWENLKDLSQAPSDKATILRVLLEKLGIGLSQDQETESSNEPRRAAQTPHLDHEGGSEPETQENGQEGVGLSEEGEEFNSGSHHQGEQDQGEEEESVSGSHNQDDQSQGEVEAQAEAPEPSVQVEQVQNQPVAQEGPVLRRSTRLRKDPSSWVNTRVYYNAQAVKHPTQAVCSFSQYPEAHCAFMVNLDENHIPRSYEEAMEDKEWKESVGAEAGAMIKNDTWFESELPKGKKAVSSKWIFTIKYKADGQIERKKTRLVARGFTQTYGEDYIETFAPVAKLHTIRIVLSLAVNLGWGLWQMDVKNAFLQGELEDEVYMYPPPGLEHLVKRGNVLRLKKAIYGLKQSPRAWYNKLSTTLNSRGFKKSELDHTLFTLTTPSGMIALLVYVDDIIITGSDKEGIIATKEFLKSMFDIKDLGEMKYFLGIEICRSKEGLFMSQRKYTLDLLKGAGAYGGKTARMPMEDGYKVPREGEIEDSKPYQDPKLYRKLVGKLIYLTITRPDICFAVNQVSQHMQVPKEHHWRMVERILMYLNGSPDQGVWMGCNGSTEVVGYCDADWAGDRADRRSTTGYCTFIGGNLVTWKSKKQKVVSCSSAEAEYRAMLKLTNELVWIKGILKHLGIDQAKPMTMHCDNQAAIHIASNSVFHERTKHIEVDCHKVRQMIVLGVILPCYTRSEDQLADVFTKAARQKTMESIHIRLGLIDLGKGRS